MVNSAENAVVEPESAPSKPRKGERTAQRILDAAESLFAERGFEATSLREIAARVGIREPGLYNHFANKRELYAAVLDRGLSPLLEAMQIHLDREDAMQAYARLPEMMTDLLAAHPAMAALFQQALQGGSDSAGQQIMREWLDRLFARAIEILHDMGSEQVPPEDLAIQTIAMFNLCTGYFLSQRVYEVMAPGSITDPENIERQKRLLRKLQRAVLLG
jgi:AcrR family transcriptional regulator